MWVGCKGKKSYCDYRAHAPRGHGVLDALRPILIVRRVMDV